MKILRYFLLPVLLIFLNINWASAAICDSGATTLCNPTNAGDLEIFIKKNIFNGVGVLIGTIAIAMVVYSGIRMILSRGESEAVEKAKVSFQWTLIGFLLSLFAFVIVSAIGKFLQARDVNPVPGQIENPLVGSSDIKSLSSVLFNGVLTVVGLLTLLLIIINGFRYMTASGNEEQATSAKQGLLWAILGLIAVLLAYVIVAATAKFFGANVT